ncbi:putative tocopherol O-methyltransferase chloroplastic [Bienertia sinuspersici]
MTEAAESGESREELNKVLATLYDDTSATWEDTWGDHMHHGYYDPSQSRSLSHHRSAQIRLIEETLRFARVSDDPSRKPKSIVDVGCGIGGATIYLANKYGATCHGITLSPKQVERAQALAAADGLADKPFADGKFDLVWVMETAEHLPDKTKFVAELARVAASGGTIIITTWCHRDLSAAEGSLHADEKELLRKICDSYYFPDLCSAADYVLLLQSLSLQDIKTENWSQYVAPFWPAAAVNSTLTSCSGWETIDGALALPLIVEGYKKEFLKYTIITCRKPK